jgi:hypothetical protein
MRLVAAIVALVLVAGATACDEGDGGDVGSKGTRAKRAIQAEAQQRAESIVLEISDFPDGWRASPAEADIGSQASFRRCVGADYSGFTIIGEADSREFAHEDTSNASSVSTVFESADQAEDAARELSEGMNKAEVEDCFREIFEETVREEGAGVRVMNVDVGELSVGAPSDIAETNPWQVAVTFEGMSGEAEGATLSAYLDFVEMREADAIATVLTYDVFSPFDSGLRNDLLRAVADRMTTSKDL